MAGIDRPPRDGHVRMPSPAVDIGFKRVLAEDRPQRPPGRLLTAMQRAALLVGHGLAVVSVPLHRQNLLAPHALETCTQPSVNIILPRRYPS